MYAAAGVTEVKDEPSYDAGTGAAAGVVEQPAKRRKTVLPQGPLAKKAAVDAGSNPAGSAGLAGANPGGASSGSAGDASHPAGFPVAWWMLIFL